MFRRFPLFHRLNTSSRRFAVVPRDSMAFYRYDWNSLVSEDPEQRALVPEFMDGLHYFPRRDEMAAALAAFAERAGVEARYDCRWESTRQEDGRFVLGTTDGEYRCDIAVFAVGMSEPWRPPTPGIELVPHYDDLQRPRRRVVPGQAGLHHRQAQLGVRDRRRAAAVGRADRARLAAPRPPVDRHRRADAAAGALPRGVRGPLLRRRQLRRRLRDRADRAQRRRLARARGGDDGAGIDGLRRRRGDRDDRLRDAARRPPRARRDDVLQGPAADADAVLGELDRAGDLLRRRGDAGTGRPAQVRLPERLGLGRRLSLQRVRPGGRDRPAARDPARAARSSRRTRSSPTCSSRRRTRARSGASRPTSRGSSASTPARASATRASCRSRRSSTRPARRRRR